MLVSQLCHVANATTCSAQIGRRRPAGQSALLRRPTTKQRCPAAASAAAAHHLSSPPSTSLPPSSINKRDSLNRGLDEVEWELLTHCSQLPGGEGADRCWDVYHWLEHKVEEAAAQGPAGAETLERLNTLARQLAGAGSVESKLAALAALANAERRRLRHDSGEASATDDQEAAAGAGAAQGGVQDSERRSQLVSLFNRMDVNQDGYLSVVEFQQAFDLLGDHLDDHTVSMVLSALDAQDGRLTLHEFLEVVDAEAIKSHSDVAKWWTAHLHGFGGGEALSMPR